MSAVTGNFRVDRQYEVERLLKQAARVTDFTVHEASIITVCLKRPWPFSGFKQLASVPFFGGRRLTSAGLLVEPSYSRVLESDGFPHYQATGFFVPAFGVHGQPLERTLNAVHTVLLDVAFP